ncbi:hypothetical protein [Salegentibacter chungangensis]|uniref:Phosphatidic acid phosphatase type 2/haloperoxidase domain-containing protein n=1 Tax=Salegentibacter chungangensis TaxID=1335724 RepID=A0ABW3NNG6_9FLAO
MKLLLKAASYIFHPLWTPFIGSLLYFMLTPRFFPYGVIKAKLLAIAIITLFIPIVFYFLLKNLGKAESIFLKNVGERKWPLFFFILLIVMVLKQILNVYNYPALYYYFIGILGSTMLSYLFALFKQKISLHMVGLTGLTVFIIAMSSFYRLNLIYSISFLILALGLTASSRLSYRAHTYQELILGFLIGLLPQIIVLKFWL